MFKFCRYWAYLISNLGDGGRINSFSYTETIFITLAILGGAFSFFNGSGDGFWLVCNFLLQLLVKGELVELMAKFRNHLSKFPGGSFNMANKIDFNTGDILVNNIFGFYSHPDGLGPTIGAIGSTFLSGNTIVTGGLVATGSFFSGAEQAALAVLSG